MQKEITFHHKEFETTVRHELLILDRPIYDTDLLNLIDLDCSMFKFDDEDYETLMLCENLEFLCIESCALNLNFLTPLIKLKELDVVTLACRDPNNPTEFAVDFKAFSHLKELHSLTVSGGDWSDISFKNIDALIQLKNLEYLTFHEFGTIDFQPLTHMPQLKCLYCGYADEVINIDAIGSLPHLEYLDLTSVEMDNLDFLDNLPDTVQLELCSIKVLKGIDYEKLSRFKDKDIDDIEEGIWY